MSCYISSNNNRQYVALESAYGLVANFTDSGRIPAVQLKLRQQTEQPRRHDKTGSRTFPGLPSGFRTLTAFELTTLLMEWAMPGQEPAYGPLFQSALGGSPRFFAGATVESAPDASTIMFTADHSLVADQALTYAGELRFVRSIPDARSVILNAPLAKTPSAGDQAGPTVTYFPATQLPSVSILDAWDPGGAIQRVIAGAAVDQARIRLNGDFHQFEFVGIGADIIDSSTFQAGQAGLQTFPVEPSSQNWNYSIVPGNLGQAWLGLTPSRIYSILEAEVVLDNALQARNREFGSAVPLCVVGGTRQVSADFTLYSSTQQEIVSLYDASRFRTPISVMLQLGHLPGQLCGIQMKAVIPEFPAFQSEEEKLRWEFRNCRAQGTSDDEIVIAFG